MSEKDMERNSTDAEQTETAPEKKTEIEHLVENFKVHTISSAEMIKRAALQAETLLFDKTDKDISFSNSGYLQFDGEDLSEKEIDSFIEKSPVFKELSEPRLPVLPKENRARLQMQSPNRLYFYWSTKNNPFQMLNSVFGGNAGNYTLVAKLVNRTQNSEEMVPIEAAGATWFDVDADSMYRAEIGFYAAHRPFVRLMFSNTVETPRKSPSPRSDFSLDWAVSSNQFAQVLDVSGYAQDAIEVALAGDDSKFAESATRTAFAQVTGKQEIDFTEDNAGEIRFVLLALASGYLVENLRGQISKNLFAKLIENAENLSAEKALNALQENFGEFADETIEENAGQTVFGISSINFPRFSRRRVLPKFAPISSLQFKVM